MTKLIDFLETEIQEIKDIEKDTIIIDIRSF